MGPGRNKVFLPLGDRPLLAHTLGVLNACPEIQEVVVAVGEGEVDECRREVVEPFELEKVTGVMRGGASRQESVGLALDYIGGAAEVVVVHDGARPLLPADLLLRAVRAGRDLGAVAPCLPLTDTLKSTAATSGPTASPTGGAGAGAGRWVTKTLDRSELRRVQTPQVFWLDLLRMAYDRAREADTAATDDAALVERLRHRVWLIPGSEENIKVTTPLDLLIARTLLQARGSRPALLGADSVVGE